MTAVIILLYVLSIGVAILTLVAQGVILASTGEQGWKIIIPFYGQYLFYKKTCDNGGLYLGLFIFLLIALLLYILVPALGIYYMLMPLLCQFLLCINLAGAYEKSTAFAFGLFFIPFVFFCILAFGKKARLNPSVA